MNRSYLELISGLPDNNQGLIGGRDVRAIVDADRPSVASEAFLPTTDSPGYAFNPASWDNATVGASTAAPAWAWLRSELLTSAETGVSNFSHIDGLLELETGVGGNGYIYDSGDTTGGVMQAFQLSASLRGSTDTQSLRGALAFYRDAGGWDTATTKVAYFPFDTGNTSPRPFAANGTQVILMNPGDTLFMRVEGYGESAVLTDTATMPSNFYVNYFQVDLVSLSAAQPAADTTSAEIPAAQTRAEMADLRGNLTWPAGGVAINDVISRPVI